MAKKKIMEEALLEAKELEQAARENATKMVIESFSPNFVSFFKDILNEVDDAEFDDDDMYGNDDEEDETMDEAEHDIGKEPDNGRRGTDASLDDDEELKEGEYSAPDPEKGQAGLPKIGQPTTKKATETPSGNMHTKASDSWEAEGSSGAAGQDPEKNSPDLPAKGKPSTKKTGEGWEDEGSGGNSATDPEKGGKNGLSGVPTPKVVKEADDEEDDEEFEKEPEDGGGDGETPDDLDVPSDLFDDGDDEIDDENDSEDTGGEDLEMSDDFEDGEEDDAEVDVDIDVDSDEDGEESTVDFDVDDDFDGEDDPLDLGDEEEFEEGLYMRKEGTFQKVTPAEYLQTRLGELDEENRQLTAALQAMKGQLGETHLFNAKLAHLNKLYMSGAFSNYEKESIAERLDSCETIDEVKGLYKTIIMEVKDKNPLDDFSAMIKEHRTAKKAKTENIYESKDVTRMRNIIKRLDG